MSINNRPDLLWENGGAVLMITVATTDDDDNQAVEMQTLRTLYFFSKSSFCEDPQKNMKIRLTPVE